MAKDPCVANPSHMIDQYLLDQEQGPSGLNNNNAEVHDVNGNDAGKSNNTTKAIFDSSESSMDSFVASSVDSAYDHNSRHDSFRFELTKKEIVEKVALVETGLVQITLRKCAYALGFEHTPVDQSRESIDSFFYDEGYSNRYETAEQQMAAWEAQDQTDEVFESGVRRAVGVVAGDDSSRSIEQLMGVYNRHQETSQIRCLPGSPSVVAKISIKSGETDMVDVAESDVSDPNNGDHLDESKDGN